LDASDIDRRETESRIDLSEKSVSLRYGFCLKLYDTALAPRDRTGESV
jgi:hypothetical protein